jgi:hypothetical protein
VIPSAFDEENGVLDGPPGTSFEEVAPLSVWRGPLADGTPVVVSCWRPDAEELAEINRTRRIWVLVMGDTMLPVLPLGTSPWSSSDG